MKKNKPVRGFWDWVTTGQWEGGDINTGTNG